LTAQHERLVPFIVHEGVAVAIKYNATFDKGLLEESGKVGNPPLTIRKPIEPAQKSFPL
jgi:hypothetical protein